METQLLIIKEVGNKYIYLKYMFQEQITYLLFKCLVADTSSSCRHI